MYNYSLLHITCVCAKQDAWLEYMLMEHTKCLKITSAHANQNVQVQYTLTMYAHLLFT